MALDLTDAQVIPLNSSPTQSLAVALNVDGAVLRLQLEVYFSEMAQYWVMDISDNAGNLLISSMPLITGSWPGGNLLMQFVYLAIGSAFIINLGQVANDYPTASQLGTDFILIWDDTPGYVETT
jgi:hypothetical protein